jgi:hypothetical protein
LLFFLITLLSLIEVPSRESKSFRLELGLHLGFDIPTLFGSFFCDAARGHAGGAVAVVCEYA